MTSGTIVMETLFGAHLYGTVVECSDRDTKAVRIPSTAEILLQRVTPSISERTKLDPAAKNTSADVDRDIWSLGKFLDLLAEGQIVALDVLFAPPTAWLGTTHHFWITVVENRHRMISKRPGSLVTYCKGQADKYGIKGSRVAAAEHAVDALLAYQGEHPGAKLGDVGPAIEAALANIEHIAFVDVPTPSGGSVRHMDVCGKRAPFTASLRSAHDIYRHLAERYGGRARAAKDNRGIDWKALSHAVRAGHQAIELLSTGHITFPRPEAQLLIDIKLGRKPYNEVAEMIENLLFQVYGTKSDLPDEPDLAFMEKLVIEFYGCQIALELGYR